MIQKINPLRVLHCKRFGAAVGVSTDAHTDRETGLILYLLLLTQKGILVI